MSMDEQARALLTRLLEASEKHLAGRRKRAAVLTTFDLSKYRSLASLQKKESFETTMRAASHEDAITIEWEDGTGQSGFIQRISVQDSTKLALFLGRAHRSNVMSAAEKKLMPQVNQFPVIAEVLSRWSKMYKVRATGPQDVADWLDAIRVLNYCQRSLNSDSVSLPIRQASAHLFNDSKRIERLAGPVDVLLTGSIDSDVRDAVAVWNELGLWREEHPVRFAGNITLERERCVALIDTPYVGLPADTVMRIMTHPRKIISIENLTTFHSEARRVGNEPVLLIYTAGMPSPSWRSMYIRLLRHLTKDVEIYHWGDIDEGGFRIAATLAKEAHSAGHILKPWRMHPNDIPQGCGKRAAQKTLERMKYFATEAGWADLAEEVYSAGTCVEQEGLM